MDTRTQTSESQHPYLPTSWSTTIPKSAGGSVAQTPDAFLDCSAPAAVSNIQYHTPHLELLPFLFPQQSIYHHAQLLHYNRLISPARGGGGLQTPPLPPVVSAPHVHATPRSRSSSKASLSRDSVASKGTAAGGHGGRSHQASDKTRTATSASASAAAAASASASAAKDISPNMSAKTQAPELPRTLPHRSIAASTPPNGNGQAQSSSVPSTPHSHARQFSFESREPSPTNGNGHSPRSAYSETNSTLPSLRPLPPRLGGCKYETAQINSRRRIPYSVGSDRLQKLNLHTVKSKLSDSDERKLMADMREVYDRLIPTDEVEENRKKLVQKLETIFNEEWPGHDIKVHLFGSSGNLLCSDDSDVDICITTAWRELEGVCRIADLLARRGMEKVVCISAAKVPIVKIWDPELGLACDMNVNNTLALENTRMVRTYVETDPRVRQLAMIIKYWTRRRVVNDAAFGGTLSSYTWICLIIAFLQLRNPPVLPALHQLPYKTTQPDGTMSDFADNLNKLQGFGVVNKSSEADLLFQFFRFYAHEFDYDKYVLSVRQGRLITKADKKWHYAINNQLCVEEPFNTSRNLGNTADEYSFRGLHLELRRAFDLISAANFEEACEQYVFPKEEEKVWSRPASQSRPVLLRSSSQSHSSRGGRGNHNRGGRQNNNYRHGGGGGNRRASSSVPAYDQNVYAPAVTMPPQDMTWFQSPQLAFAYSPQDVMTQMALQENMRQQLHLYAQSPAFLQQQTLAQQRLSASVGSTHSADRSRTNSFDNAPINAVFRPDLYALYGMGLGNFYPTATAPATTTGYGTYPSSPVTTNGVGTDLRRPPQRTAVNSDAGGASNSSSSLRSQSQPASRSASGAPARAAFAPGGHSSAGNHGSRVPHSAPNPSFMADGGECDETCSRPSSDLPQSLEGSSRTAHVNGTVSEEHASQVRKKAPSPGERRLPADQLPQTILDRRIKRTSRSPSPGAFSAGTSPAPTPPPSTPGTHHQHQGPPRPLVVNGSGLRTTMIANARQSSPPKRESKATDDSTTTSGPENALHISSSLPENGTYGGGGGGGSVAPSMHQVLVPGLSLPSMVEYQQSMVNGSNFCLVPAPTTDDASFRDRIALMNLYQINPITVVPDVQGPLAAPGAPTSSRQHSCSRQQPQSGGVAPLDLAVSDRRASIALAPENSHLSPVYEARTPSPTIFRKRDGYGTLPDKNEAQVKARPSRGDAANQALRSDDKSLVSQDGHKPQAQAQAQDGHKGSEGQRPTRTQKSAVSSLKGHAARENGHGKCVPGEADGVWHKAGKGKRKGASVQAESIPKHDSERKGG